MRISLYDEQIAEIRTMIFSIVQDALKEINHAEPYLNRKGIAKYFGVSESTISNWVSLGMPVAIINGRKLYGKQSVNQWLKSHETPSQGQNKKPTAMKIVKG